MNFENKTSCFVDSLSPYKSFNLTTDKTTIKMMLGKVPILASKVDIKTTHQGYEVYNFVRQLHI